MSPASKPMPQGWPGCADPGKATARCSKTYWTGCSTSPRPTGWCMSAKASFCTASREIFRIERGSLPEHPGAARQSRRRPIPMSSSASSAAAPFDDVKKRYRKLVTSNHPDKLIARGVPEEFIKIATTRIAAINAAYETDRARVQAGMSGFAPDHAGADVRVSPNFGPRREGVAARHDHPALYRNGDRSGRRSLALRSGKRSVVALSRARGRSRRADGARKRPGLACRQELVAGR